MNCVTVSHLSLSGNKRGLLTGAHGLFLPNDQPPPQRLLQPPSCRSGLALRCRSWGADVPWVLVSPFTQGVTYSSSPSTKRSKTSQSPLLPRPRLSITTPGKSLMSSIPSLSP